MFGPSLLMGIVAKKYLFFQLHNYNNTDARQGNTKQWMTYRRAEHLRSELRQVPGRLQSRPDAQVALDGFQFRTIGLQRGTDVIKRRNIVLLLVYYVQRIYRYFSKSYSVEQDFQLWHFPSDWFSRKIDQRRCRVFVC